jgi:hypothetical protein
MRLAFVITCAVVVPAAAAYAEVIPVTNPGFEDISGESPYNEFTFGPFSGWSLYDPGNITTGGAGPGFYIGTLTPQQPNPVTQPGVYTFFPAGAPEGQRVGIAFNYANTATGPYGLQQTLAATLTPHTTFTLQVDVGNIASGTAVDGTFFNLSGFPGYRVDLLAGGQVIASNLNLVSIAEGQFATVTVQLNVGATHDQLGQQLGIRLVNLNAVDPAAPSADREVDFDHVRLTATAVPEPGVAGAVALIACGWCSRRRRR